MIWNGNQRKLFFSFKEFIKQIFKDAMLFMICLAPILYILFLRYGLPAAEKFLLGYIDLSVIVAPYYLLFDLFLAVLTSIMFSYASAMVILGEIDDGITSYIAVTPMGKEGYLISRLVLPLILSLLIAIISLSIFSLTEILISKIFVLSIMSAMLGYIMSMMVISMSENKVEGMAVMKLSGLLLMGIPAPFFIEGNIQYLAAFLPSLWFSKFAMESKIIYLIFYILISIVWILVLTKRFKRKLLH